MAKLWKKGRGKLGPFHPLLGRWIAEAEQGNRRRRLSRRVARVEASDPRCRRPVDIAIIKNERMVGRRSIDPRRESRGSVVSQFEFGWPPDARVLPRPVEVRMEKSDWAGHIIDHYERHALAWDSDRRNDGWYDKPWHDRFIANLPEGASVLDLGCGSGAPVAIEMVAHGLHVTGVDASPSLISLCRDRLPDQEWIVADMRSLKLGRRFSGVLAWDSFFHLNPGDQRHMFDVFAAHAARPAVLMFSTGPTDGEVIGSYRGDPLYHASLSAAEYEALLGQSGFNVVAHAIDDWEMGGGRTIWMARSNA
jgi:SAM-dependent methyltransferase